MVGSMHTLSIQNIFFVRAPFLSVALALCLYLYSGCRFGIALQVFGHDLAYTSSTPLQGQLPDVAGHPIPWPLS